ncbi:CoA transferase [Bordetella pertussis]
MSLQNRGCCVQHGPRSSERRGRGKRPFHTGIPAFLTQDGAPLMSFGIMGGNIRDLMHGISAVQGAKYAEHGHPGVISRELYAAIGIYPRDGHIALSAMRDQQVTDFIGLAGRADLLADPRYATQQARYDNQDELRALIAAELAKQPTAHWIEAARRIDLICQPVQTYDQFRQDPQVRTYELFQDMDLGYDMPLPAVRMPA